jgi:Glyoxalase-like domain
MTLSFFTVVFDADDPQLVGRFWAAALERELTEGDPGEWATLPGEPRIDFMKVPEGKTTKNRMHLDWSVADREAEVQRLLGLGATRLWDVKEKFGEEDMEWTTLADSEGNEFCVIQSAPPSDRNLATVVLDAASPHKVGRFWSTALQRELVEVEPDKDYWLPGDLPLTFVKVSEPKTTKNRVHIDWHAPDREVEVANLMALGATRLWDVTNENFEWTRWPTSRATSSALCRPNQADGLRSFPPSRHAESTPRRPRSGPARLLLTACSRRNDTGWHKTTQDDT